MKANLIFESPKAKVFECEDGTYTVHVLRTHSFDGMIDKSWDVERFLEDGIHSSSGVCTHNFPIRYPNCTHNFPIRYPNDGKSLRERALEYAERRAL